MNNKTTNDYVDIPLSTSSDFQVNLEALIKEAGINKEKFDLLSVRLYRGNSEQSNREMVSLVLSEGGSVAGGISFPVHYQRKQLGYLNFGESCGDIPGERQRCAELAKQVALLAKRLQVRDLSEHYLGRPLSLSGGSPQVFNLESFIEKAASVSCPAIIAGDFGCEKLVIASAIHFSSAARHKPFVEINCSSSDGEFGQKLHQYFDKDFTGTLYLQHVDELSQEQQVQLLDLMSAGTDSVSGFQASAFGDNIRVLVSTAKPLNQLVEEGRFSRQLFAQLNFLQVTIPALKERQQDIPALLNEAIQRYRYDDEQVFSAEAISTLSRYHWPENMVELERIVARLASLSLEPVIELAHIKEYAPEVLSSKASVQADINTPPPMDEQELTACLLDKHYDQLNKMHLGLKKALVYIGDNYTRDITLNELAQNAFVSPSHLSFLFKNHLNRSFKQVLSALRIERAKLTFLANPYMRITDVSLEVGFGDLSHFEKVFKRYTGVTPRAFKNSHRQIARVS